MQTQPPAGRRSLAKNFLFLTGGEVLSKFLTLAAIAYIARIAGPTGFGYLEFAMSVVLLSGILVHQGFGLYGTREIARAPESTDRLVAEITGIRFLLAALAYAGLVLFVFVVDRPAVLERLVLVYGVSLVFMPMALAWVFQGHERMQTVAVLQVTRQTVFAGVVFMLLRDSRSLWPAALAEVASVAAVAAGSVWLYRRHFAKRPPLPARPSVGLLRDGGIIGLSRIFWSVRMSGATVVVGLIATEQDVGFFGAAMRLLLGLHVFIWLYFINLLPSLSRAWKEGAGPLQRQIDGSMHVVGWLGLGAGMLWFLLASPAIRLVYGPAFAPAAQPLQWFALLCVLAAIHGHYRYGLIAADRHRDEMFTSALGTAVSLPLIPVGYMSMGVTGAALALVAGEVTIWFTSWLFSRRRLELEINTLFLVRPVICVAILFAALRFVPEQLPIAARAAIVTIGLGVAAYISDGAVRRGSREAVLRLRGRS